MFLQKCSSPFIGENKSQDLIKLNPVKLEPIKYVFVIVCLSQGLLKEQYLIQYCEYSIH